jgi:HSP90 family molecular chaperone
MKTEYETNWGWKVQNDNKPIWVRSPKEVEKESYDEFFKATFKCVHLCVCSALACVREQCAACVRARPARD